MKCSCVVIQKPSINGNVNSLWHRISESIPCHYLAWVPYFNISLEKRSPCNSLQNKPNGNHLGIAFRKTIVV